MRAYGLVFVHVCCYLVYVYACVCVRACAHWTRARYGLRRRIDGPGGTRQLEQRAADRQTDGWRRNKGINQRERGEKEGGCRKERRGEDRRDERRREESGGEERGGERDLSRQTNCKFFRNDVMQDFNNRPVGFNMCRHSEMPGDHRKYHIILMYLTTTILDCVQTQTDRHTHTCTHTHARTSYPSLSLPFFHFPLLFSSFYHIPYFLSPFHSAANPFNTHMHTHTDTDTHTHASMHTHTHARTCYMPLSWPHPLLSPLLPTSGRVVMSVWWSLVATRLAEVFLALLVVSITKYAPTSYFKIETNLKGRSG